MRGGLKPVAVWWHCLLFKPSVVCIVVYQDQEKEVSIGVERAGEGRRGRDSNGERAGESRRGRDSNGHCYDSFAGCLFGVVVDLRVLHPCCVVTPLR